MSFQEKKNESKCIFFYFNWIKMDKTRFEFSWVIPPRLCDVIGSSFFFACVRFVFSFLLFFFLATRTEWFSFFSFNFGLVFLFVLFFFAVINRRWWPCVAPQMAALSPASVSLSGRKWIRSHWIRRVWWRTYSALTPQIEIDQRRMECHALFAGTQFVTRSTINSVNH